MHLTRRATALSAAALISTGLSACGDDKPIEPGSTRQATPRSSGSATPSSSASGSTLTGDKLSLPKDVPAAALKKTRQGAVAFGKYYYEQFGEADHTGDTTTISALASDSCVPCAEAVSAIDSDSADGQTRSANPYKISNVQATHDSDHGYNVTMTVHVRPHHVYKNKKVISDVDADNFTVTEAVVWNEGRWEVSDWSIS